MTDGDQREIPERDEADQPPLPDPREGAASYVARPFHYELRSPFERRQLRRSPLWDGEGIEPGEGRPVLIYPGFMSGYHKAKPLLRVMRAAGWEARIADVGRNSGPAYHSVDAAARDIDELIDETGERVTIIGHSRGGQFGRVLAVRHPEKVRRVIAIGAPLRTKYPPFLVVKLPAEALDWVWRRGTFGPVDPDREQEVDDDRYLPFPDEVDLFSIYSRTDGIVDWRYCHDEWAEMVEISASHLGLISSIEGIEAIASVLPQGHDPI